MEKETLNIDLRNKTLRAQLNGIAFKEKDSHIIYLPSLQLSAYGDNFKEANEMVKATVHEFSKNLLELPENKINSILKDLGWIKHKFFKKRMSNLSETTFEDIKKEFNLPDNTPVERIPIAV
ncbi:MAG: hypothetical protein PHW92_11825 [Lutibacter sp.]|nr:hypothetical protein [Lutibacter sp.]